MRILVTGGAGFVGSNLAKRLAADGHVTAIADDFSSSTWTNLIDYPGDVLTVDVSADISALSAMDRFDVIFHQASITDTTVMDQRKMMHNNVEGFRALLDLAVKWESRIVWASSAATYGRGESPNKESQPPAPLNVYGYSKLAMERLVGQYASRLSQPVIGLRYFNVYGPGEGHKGKFASMILQLSRQTAQGKRPRIFTDGSQRRDFVHVEDVIQANLLAMTCKTGGVFNVGSGASYSFNQVVAELNRVMKINLPAEYFENPYDFFQTWTEADLTQSRKMLKYDPRYDLAKGVDAYYASGKLGI